MLWEKLHKHRDLGLLVLRLGFGIGFVYYHGWGKVTGGPERWEGLGGAMSRFGIDFAPQFWGFMAMLSESLFALFIAVGFLFRPAALFLAITMFVAWVGHVVSGQGTPAHAFKNMAVALGLVFIGPGKYTVDAWLARRKNKDA